MIKTFNNENGVVHFRRYLKRRAYTMLPFFERRKEKSNMSTLKVFAGALVCSAMASAFADTFTYPDLEWRMEGSTVRDAASSVESQTTIPELALSSWDIGESATRDIYRYPFKGIILTIR